MISTQLFYIPLPWCPCTWAYAVFCLGHVSKQNACKLYAPIIHCMFWEIIWSHWFFRYYGFKLSKLTSCHVSLLLFPVKAVLDLQVQVWLSAAVCFCHQRNRFLDQTQYYMALHISRLCKLDFKIYCSIPQELNSNFCSWKLKMFLIYAIKLSITSDLLANIFFRYAILNVSTCTLRHSSEKRSNT